ncbi:MAG: bifunctional phosphoribosylaminoimidazolecarboxamide formyltransferase/IMP cyclohydrolase [Deltaproteobacteria bacterium]|nr:bifunctional phosphoribosylaminoimidazolecarboxamide formyltransferase/IMP cyclohydrolase [Deltaproteobacteria bacterium]
MRHALISVSDKTGLIPFARSLVGLGFTVLSTGGTARGLAAAGIPVTPVSEHTGFPEIMDGRVKTLHPRIHGGILGDRDRHATQAADLDVPWIELVAVNLYPFDAVTADPDVAFAEAIEHIDIGGPTMVRAAAKNHQHVAVITDPADYGRVAAALEAGEVPADLRRELALAAFRHTARYDARIAEWLADRVPGSAFPAETALGLTRVQPLRYGENPHQRASFYADGDRTGRSLARMTVHQGKELSFNNIADLDAALRVAFEFTTPAAAVVKHNNPCGCATGHTSIEAFAAALAGDPVSAYGGVLALNRPVDAETAEAIRATKVFFEVIVAPGWSADALQLFRSRENLRVLSIPEEWALGRPPGGDGRRVMGGWLLQDWDVDVEPGWTVASRRHPTEEESRALRFAWKVCRNVKSNAIALARSTPSGEVLNGVGAGQMSRVDSVRLALGKGTLPIAGSVLASDAFFPFADGPKAAAEAGISAMIQPGGSIRDAEVLAVADEAGMAVVLTGIRHFRH